MNKPLPSELIDELEVLEGEDIERVFEYARSLKVRRDGETRRTEPMKLAGSVSTEEIVRIESAVEEGCERIDHEGW